MPMTVHPLRSRRLAAAVGVLTAGSLVLTACSSGGGGGGGGGGDTIKVAQISTISGGYPFGDTVKGTQSYFDMVNAAGGIDGKKIKFESGDDKGQASEAAQLARKFVLQDGAVALIGNTSLIDCDANKAFYESRNVMAIGGGAQAACFSQPNWVPVNTGPYVGHAVMWEYLFNVIKPTSVCAIEQNDATSQPYYDQLYKWYPTVNPAAKWTSITYTNDASQNPTPAVTAAKQAGCDAITLSTVAPNAVAFRKAAKSVGLDATIINVGSGYDTSVPETLGALGEPGALGPKDKGFFVGAELAKVDSADPKVQEMVTQFGKDGTPVNFWSQIGWVSAAVFVDGLKQAKAQGADITTAKGVTDTLKAMDPYDSGFAASPLTVGDGSAHSPNKGGQELLVQGGKWVIAPDQNDGDFMSSPDLPAPTS